MNLETSSPRRDFLRATALAGGGLVIGFLVPGARRFAMAQEATAAAPTAFVPNAFLSIAADDTITVQLAHAEMGQGIWTRQGLIRCGDAGRRLPHRSTEAVP
ncbi:twin-arginine translocation signal domain-containing protein [Pseudoxanthomonas mexicana]